MASLAFIGASATLLALLFLALRPLQERPSRFRSAEVVRVLTCCCWCRERDLVRVRTEEFCADCNRPVCARHAQQCALCAHTTCNACCETWSGLDGVACGECQRRVS